MLTDPGIEAIPPAEREVIGEKVTHRLAQEPGSYKVPGYVRQVARRRDTGRVLAPAAPAGVLGRAAVDVSFLAGLLVEKFRWHLPLYRQHARLADAGIAVSRRSLTNWAGRAIDLLRPVVEAQSGHILSGDVIAMDETSIKAGRTGPGKMRAAYFWPVYGQDGELVFHYAPSRAHQHVEGFLGAFSGTLLTDGYSGVRGVCRASRHRPRALLGAYPAQVRGGEERRSGRGRTGAVADRGAVPGREEDPQEEASGS